MPTKGKYWTYQEAKALGLCPKCQSTVPGREPVPGYILCNRCHKHSTDRGSKLHYDGRCVRCGKKYLGGRIKLEKSGSSLSLTTTCLSCKAKARVYYHRNKELKNIRRTHYDTGGIRHTDLLRLGDNG